MSLKYYKLVSIAGISILVILFGLVYEFKNIEVDLSCTEINSTGSYCIYTCNITAVSTQSPSVDIQFEVKYSNWAEIIEKHIESFSGNTEEIIFQLPRRNHYYKVWAFAYTTNGQLGSFEPYIQLYC